ncbi:MAG: TIR domain-containing protein [Lysobacter sp.]|nr:TIR domain-containing protein [Lysobacter sp.]
MQDEQDRIDPKDMTPEQAHAEALRRIEAAVESGQDWLDLGDLPLAAIPLEIGRLAVQLRQLGLGLTRYDTEQAAWEYQSEYDASFFARGIDDLGPIADLTALQMLDISWCTRLTSLATLARLTALQTLDVSGCIVKSLTPLTGLTALQTLYVSECTYVKSLDPLTGLTGLQTLNVSFCSNLTSFAALADLTALQNLDVSNCNQLTSLELLAGLTALQTLDVGGCTGLISLSAIDGLTALQTLDVSGCTGLISLSPIDGLTALQTLNISGCQVKSIAALTRLTVLQTLDISWCTELTSLKPLAGLRALQTLDMRGCTQLSSFDLPIGITGFQKTCSIAIFAALQRLTNWRPDYSPLDPIAGLTALQSLNISGCHLLTDISPLAGLTALQSLNISECYRLTDISPLADLASLQSLLLYGAGDALSLQIENLLAWWPSLSKLSTDRMHAVPPEILSSSEDNNCLPRLRSWWHDLQQGEVDSHELKLFILGNGGVGKSELFRRLRGDDFHGDLPSTHGIQLGRFELCKHHDDSPIFLNAWDFGGQDVYLGTHALFLKSRAIFVLAWHPDMETDAPYTEAVSGLEMRHRPLQYWLDYIHSLAGDEGRVIVVQTQCARESDEVAPPLRETRRFAWCRQTISCAIPDDGVDSLRDLLKRAARHRLETPVPPRMPASWLAVRGRLVALREIDRTIDRTRFDAICADTHHGASSEALLHYLHQAGDVFHQPGLFGDAIVLDQQWALDGIYTLFDRSRVLPLLRGHNGLFAPEMLDALAWNGRYSNKEQALLLSMMASCDLIFPAHQWGETRYYAMIDALPDAAASANHIAMVWPVDAQAVEAVAEYVFLHDGVLRALLARIGRLAGRDAVYWRHGVCLYDARTASRARIDTEQHADGSGRVRMRATGPDANALCAKLITLLEDIRIGAPPQITRDDASARSALPRPSSERDHDIQPAPIPPLPGQKPVVYISYAWGTQDKDGRRPLQEFAVSLQRSLETEFDVRRDQEAMLLGDSLEAFMREIGRGARVLILLSDAYVYSRNCMKELENLNARNQSDPDQLRRCALPLIVDTSFSLSDDKRINYVDYWVAEAERLRQSVGDRDPTRHLSVWKTIKTVEKIADIADEMLAFMNDVLMPRGMQCLSEDDFATVKAALHRLPGA